MGVLDGLLWKSGFSRGYPDDLEGTGVGVAWELAWALRHEPDDTILDNVSAEKPAHLVLLAAPAHFLANVGAPVCWIWMFIALLLQREFLLAFLSLPVVGILLGRFGTATIFAVAASVLHFYLGACGLWLPIVSYLALAMCAIFDPILHPELQHSWTKRSWMRRYQSPKSN